MQNVNKNRVPKPTPDSRVSVLFVVCFLAILAIIGISGWFYLSETLRSKPDTVTARAEIAKPIAVTPPIETEKAAPEAEKEREPESPVSETPEIAPAPPTVAMPPQADMTTPDTDQRTADADIPLPSPEADISAPKPPEPDVEPLLYTRPVQEESEPETNAVTPDPAPAEEPSDMGLPEKPIATFPTPTTEQLPAADKAASSPEPPTETPLINNFPASREDAPQKQTADEGIDKQVPKTVPEMKNETIPDSGPEAMLPEVKGLDKQTPETALDIRNEPIPDSEPEMMLPQLTEKTAPSEQNKRTQDTHRDEKQTEATRPEVAMTDDASTADEASDTQSLSAEQPDVPMQSELETEELDAPTAIAEASEPADKTAAIDTANPQQPLWQKNAQPFSDPDNLPRIAIVISEMGISDTYTNAAIKNLPAAMTLAFNPYAQNLQKLVAEARSAGHEVLLQLPMEPKGYPAYDPGPQALLTNLSTDENLARLDWALKRFAGYVGITNQMGSKFTASAEYIRPVLGEIKSRGLLYLDSRTASDSVAASVARDLGIPVAINNRFLDHKANGETIDARLEILEEIAKRTGSAIGVGYPHPLTFEHLRVWAATLAEKGIVLAPVSALVNRQEIK